MFVQPYLFFDGRCDEALKFYGETLGAEVTMLMRFKDGPPQPEGSQECGPDAPPGDKVMHANVKIRDTQIMASDGRCTGNPSFQGFTLTLNAKDAADADKLFASLGQGGQVQMPLTETFFAHRFGMVADKFGMSWMVIFAKTP